ncbi:MAG: formylglycine-generating enzyme family protein [Gemmatimonadetes bacterium]|nr:formylglycine-generating enzyme family protein [Gemmatimonadota bacterium]
MDRIVIFEKVHALCPLAGLPVAAFCLLAAAGAADAHAVRAQSALAKYVESIEGTLVTIEMMPVPGGVVQIATREGMRSASVDPFWIARTEIPWEAYDVFVFGLDRGSAGADAIARPSKPYVLPGEQFGHQGHPAIGITHLGAERFAEWLSARTGRRYRLPTEAEWELACRTGAETGAATGTAWTAATAGGRTHAVGTSQPDARGLFDMRGNVAEWVNAADGPVARGGAFNDPAADVHCGARRLQTPAWNASDPQLPKSRWWLPDAPFIGFRIVRVS